MNKLFNEVENKISTNDEVENKLLAKSEFLQLNKLLNRFNIFEATDMGRREIKHTKFLSYLLDPNESHGLGEVFIKNFITRLSTNIKNFPRILDLDFSFTEIKPEYKSENKSENGKFSIDVLIKIPKRGVKEKVVVIAIENKIDSSQGLGQLDNYSKILQKYEKNDLFKVYLTFNEEEPNDKTWSNVTYEDVVLPSLRLTIQLIDEIGSANLKAALNDYLELLLEDENGNKEKELLANHLIEDNEIKKFFSKGKKDKKKHFGDLYIKHKKTVNFICQLDSDIRTPCMTWWKTLEKTGSKLTYNDEVKELVIVFESSTRGILRFSVLTETNRLRLALISNNERKWLASECPIAFEIFVDVVYKKSDEDVQSDTEKEPVGFRCNATLTLGPLNSDQDRSKLYTHLYSALPNKPASIKEVNVDGVYNRLISNKKDQWTEVKSKSNDYPKLWIEKNILSENGNSLELSDWIESLSIKLNKALDYYFKLSAVDNNQQ